MVTPEKDGGTERRRGNEDEERGRAGKGADEAGRRMRRV